ncbi:hypothetical protein BAUCODRAFT_198961 [Baudoinia panamericana UAMH 10762]|uniref:Uncharacterized protein n=1 Tax=Baudoinia panamericana (strain UAMH 10762) TaxID=717646 RepID=M2NAA5_BAUPA|nr:uncharacterized protein BAUCODRAFT_198961 [Baudoinia panamericana UAMH 10762]EMD01154.1 hypothetical protein BAUCODRAFT_198961 [Baudoinia panamericana UAMH 10762]
MAKSSIAPRSVPARYGSTMGTVFPRSAAARGFCTHWYWQVSVHAEGKAECSKVGRSNNGSQQQTCLTLRTWEQPLLAMARQPQRMVQAFCASRSVRRVKRFGCSLRLAGLQLLFKASTKAYYSAWVHSLTDIEEPRQPWHGQALQAQPHVDIVHWRLSWGRPC